MEKDGERYCDRCGQIIPKMSKLAVHENGKDFCLACNIKRAQDEKGLRH
jgi:formylmethanofuran dehydrogenase subunit E